MSDDHILSRWAAAAVLIARLILVLVFGMAFGSKLMMFDMIGKTIAAAGFPFPSLLAGLAAAFEFALVLALITGAWFSEMMLLGAVYVVFLALAFHGPSHWTDPKQLEFGAFISHFPFAAGLLFAAANGPGKLLTVTHKLVRRSRRDAEK